MNPIFIVLQGILFDNVLFLSELVDLLPEFVVVSHDVVELLVGLLELVLVDGDLLQQRLTVVVLLMWFALLLVLVLVEFLLLLLTDLLCYALDLVIQGLLRCDQCDTLSCNSYSILLM